MLIVIASGLAAACLIRATLVEVGGFMLGSPNAARQVLRLCRKRRFWAGGAFLVVVLTVSLDLYGSNELSKVVPLYSVSYVLIA